MSEATLFPSFKKIKSFCQDRYLLGQGGNAAAFALDLPGLENYALRIPYGLLKVLDALADFPAIPCEDPLLRGHNYGHAVARYGEKIQLLHRQPGEPCGVPCALRNAKGREDKNNALYEDITAKAARMPQKAYDLLLEDLAAIDGTGYAVDPSKANNLLIDEEGGRFGIVDLITHTREGLHSGTAGYFLVMMFDNSFAYRYGGGKEASLQSDRKMILDKLVQATEAIAFPFEEGPSLNSSLRYSLELAGYADGTEERAALEKRLLTTQKATPLPRADGRPTVRRAVANLQS